MMPSRMASLPEGMHNMVEGAHSTQRQHIPITGQVEALQNRILLTNSLPSGGQSVSTSKQKPVFTYK